MKNKTLQTIDPFVDDNRARNYDSNGRRPHTLTVSYAYDIPNVSRRWDNVIAKAVLDNWQVSGITSVFSGTYTALTYSYTNVPTGVLSGTGAIDAPTFSNLSASRPDIVCNPNVSRGDRTFARQFNTDCVKPPSDAFRLGNALYDEYHAAFVGSIPEKYDEYLGPGFMNWDISLFKNIPVGGTRRLQLRAELYNAFNTDEWTDVNRNAVFDFQTGALTNANTFGSLTGATQSARRIQLAARFTF